MTAMVSVASRLFSSMAVWADPEVVCTPRVMVNTSGGPITVPTPGAVIGRLVGAAAAMTAAGAAVPPLAPPTAGAGAIASATAGAGAIAPAAPAAPAEP